MKPVDVLSPSLIPRFLSIAFSMVALAIATGCGSSSKTPVLKGNTSITVMVSAAANDQLVEYDLGFESISLTSQSSKVVSLLSKSASGPSLGAEFMHINGTADPLVTANIPQDVYTSAAVTLAPGADIACVALGSVEGEESLSSAQYNAAPTSVTVNLPTPITVTGASMGLSLDLLVSQSATIGSCLDPAGFYGYSIAPTFSLTPLSMSSSPTNSANGKVMGIDGQITAMGSSGSSITLSIPDLVGARTLLVSADGNATYQGASGFSALAVGTFVDLDGAIQSDGSVLATRIAVADPSAGDVLRGPLMEVTPSVSKFFMHPRQWQGKDIAGFGGGPVGFAYGATTFQISGQLANLGSLPFVPTFGSSNMVPGQEVYISATTIPSGGYPVATTVTLMPQTIDGTVTASSQVGNFTDYTVSLASYDLFPMLAVQPGQTAVENNPSQVEVYVDSNTQSLNTAAALGIGSTFRFYGLAFNDNGTLRMDCAQVKDGVAFSTLSTSAAKSAPDQLRIVRYRGQGAQQTTREIRGPE